MLTALAVPPSGAFATPLNETPNAPGDAIVVGNTQLAGAGYIDVSQLIVVGMIDRVTGEITSVTPSAPPSRRPIGMQVSPQITMPPCAGRKDFYRIIDTSGYQRCFANSGTWSLSSGYWSNILYLCPGNNRGRTEWVNGTTNTWSVWRGAEWNYDTCYSFGSGVPAWAVQIL